MEDFKEGDNITFPMCAAWNTESTERKEGVILKVNETDCVISTFWKYRLELTIDKTDLIKT